MSFGGTGASAYARISGGEYAGASVWLPLDIQRYDRSDKSERN